MSAKPAINLSAEATDRPSAEFERAASALRAPWEEGEWDRASTPAAPPGPPPRSVSSAGIASASLRSDPPSQVVRLSAPQVVSDRPKSKSSFPAPTVAQQAHVTLGSNSGSVESAGGGFAAGWSNAPVPVANAASFSSIPPLSPPTFESSHGASRDSGADFFAQKNQAKSGAKYLLYAGIALGGLVLIVSVWAIFFRGSGAANEVSGNPQASGSENAATGTAKPPEAESEPSPVAPSIPEEPTRHRLTIVSNVVAQVSVDEQIQASLSDIELSDGAHTIVVSAEGYQSETRRVNLTRDTSISVNLRPEARAAAPTRQRASHNSSRASRRRRPASSIRRSGFVSRNPY